MIRRKNPHRHTEPIFRLECPLLFAHRGGALEAAESTAGGFRYALDVAKSDVLELDVQLTSDGQFVVWHGPDLDNVRIEKVDDRPFMRSRRMICDYEWTDLQRAWVADPGILKVPVERRDLSTVSRSEDRRLLLLSELLKMFGSAPLNIEMKESFKGRINGTDRRGLKDNVAAFIGILDKHADGRPIVVASSSYAPIQMFRTLSGNRYPTGLSLREQLLLRFFPLNLNRRCLETSYHNIASGKGLIQKARRLGGSTFVFLTRFGSLLPAMDHEEHIDEEKIYRILGRGVDGIMTDRPKRVRKIIEAWKTTL